MRKSSAVARLGLFLLILAAGVASLNFFMGAAIMMQHDEDSLGLRIRGSSSGEHIDARPPQHRPIKFSVLERLGIKKKGDMTKPPVILFNKQNASKVKKAVGPIKFSVLERLGVKKKVDTTEPPPILNAQDEAAELPAVGRLLRKEDPNEQPFNIAINRFPTFGTGEFIRQCPWTLSKPSNKGACTILARPPPTSGEGVSQWTAIVVAGHMMAQQSGCRFLLDYGPNVTVTQVLEPFAGSIDWRMPSDYNCSDLQNNCHISSGSYIDKNTLEAFGEISNNGDKKMAAIPNFRSSYRYSVDYVQHRMNSFHDLEKTLPGFDLATGMACSLGSLFHLPQSAAQYQPDLFTKLLPTLSSKDVLVIAVYIRTGRTEVYGTRKEGANVGARSRAKLVVDCALQQERILLASSSKKSRVVWMVLTDSQDMKYWVPTNYANANVTTPFGDIPREILTTQSRGAHTKASIDPSTADFSEAMLDWYLIGESDIVVADSSGPSFGDTAALRTARPYYKVPRPGKGSVCQEMVPVLKW
eukprot:CAMPEP_0119016388 /NCGR_PEP_ID=MMETSP1176-20130426/12511_1 /TAXON_ID=265551 /ORGANISM="Synedropsis recta cf, Strain CCMP1620" /LENGTH=526 /DNA_ID=CAMNT_0006969771 /DNA_START=57 /DNA_END=1637 /DNA_ORIENTATION=-